MMQQILAIIGVTCASLAGTALGYVGISTLEDQKIARSYKQQAGALDQIQGSVAMLEVKGLIRSVLSLALNYSRSDASLDQKKASIWLFQEQRLRSAIQKSGLQGKLTLAGCARTRRTLAVSLGIAGAAIGILFSELLAAIAGVAGFALGFAALQTALDSEVKERSVSVEAHLSQLIEVLVLGLRSGLSFDKSLEFYCHYFKGSLSALCSQIQTQWQHGLITREEGLHLIANAYDSQLLARIMESIIRALRFGTSLAETLSNAGEEIRVTRKCELEEKVAKAPVKMLIPIGTLILPAMLILILGPILLDLITNS